MRQQLGKKIATEGRITIWETGDDHTPYIVSLGQGTATLACVLGEGEVEGEQLTAHEFSVVQDVAIDFEDI